MLIKKGMKVRVISGAHKGSEGKVLFTSPKILIETSDNVDIIEVEPDNHFIGAILEFHSLIRHKERRVKHYQDIMAQSRSLDDIKNYATILNV